MSASAANLESMGPGTAAEEVLDAFHRPRGSEADSAYLAQEELVINEEVLMDEHGYAVMMKWEQPLMKSHADFICGREGSQGSPSHCGAMLNIGFGMGLVDDAIQSHSPALHVICEAHPQVLARAEAWAKGKSNVRLAPGRWQDVLLAKVEALGPGFMFDGVFFDTYEETVEDLLPLLSRILRPGGRFSYCNVYQPHQAERNVAFSAYLAGRLSALGFRAAFRPLSVAVPTPEEWLGAKSPYWLHATYLVPHCFRGDEPTTPGGGGAGGGAGCGASLPPGNIRQQGDGAPAVPLLWQAKLWSVDQAARALLPPGESGVEDSAACSTDRAPSLLAVWQEVERREREGGGGLQCREACCGEHPATTAPHGGSNGTQ